VSRQGRVALAATALGVLCVVATAVAAAELDRPFAFFTRDPSAELGGPYYTGFLSLLGVLVLWGGAAACGFAGGLLRRARDPAAAPIIAFSALSGIVAVDDVFQLHEAFAPGTLGIRQEVGETAYVVAAVVLVWIYRRILGEAGWAWPAITAALLGGAVSADFVNDVAGVSVHVIEDGLKFVGYVTWTSYLTTLAVSKITRIVHLEDHSAPMGDGPLS
jgi:hypothetical protein